MQYPAKVLPRASRYFFPRRSCCFWTWKSVKFVWTVCYSEVLKSLQKVSEDSIVLMQSSSSNYRRNRAESWCRKPAGAENSRHPFLLWFTCPVKLGYLLLLRWMVRLLKTICAGAEETKITVCLTFSEEQSQLFRGTWWAMPWPHIFLYLDADTGWYSA